MLIAMLTEILDALLIVVVGGLLLMVFLWALICIMLLMGD